MTPQQGTTHTSKLSLGQTAFFMRENAVGSMPIGSITITATTNEFGKIMPTIIVYNFRIFDVAGKFMGWFHLNENLCFATKQELLDSL